MGTTDHTWRRRIVAAGLLACLGAGACSGEGTRGSETGADVDDLTTGYFDDSKYLGEQVTVSAEVTRVLSARSFELAGDGYGDDSLLVVSAGSSEVIEKGNVAKVTGTVEEFSYDAFAKEYGLVDEPIYDSYSKERLLVASSIDSTVAD